MSKVSLFRKLQNDLVRKFAESCKSNTVIEWGGQEKHNYAKYFKKDVKYVLSNIDSENELVRQDLTNLTHSDNSIEAALCISVLQHVFELDKAIDEIIRVLKPGGKCLITNGFLFPVCMPEDYYRLTPTYWKRRLKNEAVDYEVFEIGNMYSVIDTLLMRPYGKFSKPKFVLNKVLSVPFKFISLFYKERDSSPLGVGVIITKR